MAKKNSYGSRWDSKPTTTVAARSSSNLLLCYATFSTHYGADTDTRTCRQQGDLMSPYLFLQINGSKLNVEPTGIL
jgi:hypothetical protein